MLITRRQWLLLAPALATSRLRAASLDDGANDLERRITRVIDEYSSQGFHRTGTGVDRQSGDWLCEGVRRAGLMPAREPFDLSRVDPGDSSLIVNGRRIAGQPLFDGAFTGADGIRGRLGAADTDADIGIAEGAPNTAAAGLLGNARRQQHHKALVFVTRGGRPGLCPSNADSFRAPFGPPVLQVSSEESGFLREQAQGGAQAQLIATATRTPASAFNVTARVKGKNGGLPALVVMTPRSGWYSCASERGGGIACWLELMRTFARNQPGRDILFVASSGHELGHLGIDAFIDRRPGVVAKSAAWIHLGANIGSAVSAAPGAGNTIQASDDESEAILSRAMADSNLSVARRNPRGTVPGGEAEAVHRGGGRYVSVIGANALFHNQADRGINTVDAPAIARFAEAFASVARALIAAERAPSV